MSQPESKRPDSMDEPGFFSRVFIAGIRDRQKFVEYWAKARTRGKTSFILRHGLGFALVVGAGSQFALFWLRRWLSGTNSLDMSREENVIGLMVAIPLYILGGLLYGLAVWKQCSRTYERLKNM